MIALAICSAGTPRRRTPTAADQVPVIEVCRASGPGLEQTFLDMHYCKFCRQINHRYAVVGVQLSECRRGFVNVVWG